MEKYTDKSLLNAIGLSYGELSLKGKNRGQFERKLRNRINRNLKGFDFKLIEDLSKLYVLIDPKDLEKITEKLKKVFGIVGINQSTKVSQEDEKIKEKVLQIMRMKKEPELLKFLSTEAIRDFPLILWTMPKKLGLLC